MKKPREYQDSAINAVFNYLFTKSGNPIVVAPVSAGKSLMIAEIIRRLTDLFPHIKILVLTHDKNLIKQNLDELYGQMPFADVGIYCAGLKQRRLHHNITFASIQSIAKKANFFPRPPEIILIDEVHLVSHKDDTQYREFIKECKSRNLNMRVVGVTGTPFRSDTGRIDAGHNALFDDIAYEIEMGYMIDNGWWAKPVSPKTSFEYDTSAVPMRGPDFDEDILQEIVNTGENNRSAVNELIELGKDRKRWLVFTAGIQHAEDVTFELQSRGIDARCIHSGKPASENDAILEAHKRGEFLCLVNVAKLTTGYNDPKIDLICLMRPLRSPVLYVQIIGRGVRVVYADGYDLDTVQGRLDAIAASHKPNVLIVDFGGAVKALGPIDQISIKKLYEGEKENDGGGEAITKICPDCGTECAASQRYCYNCSYCFIILDSKASDSAVVSADIEPEWVQVLDVYYDEHIKKGSAPTLKVSYATMVGFVREWVCFEHHKFEVGDNRRHGWNMAVKWHNKRMPDTKPPNTIGDAIAMNYPKPSRILIKPKGKYWDILDYEWDGEKQQINEEDYFDIPF